MRIRHLPLRVRITPTCPPAMPLFRYWKIIHIKDPWRRHIKYPHKKYNYKEWPHRFRRKRIRYMILN